jgi:hypothetical protein
MAHLDLTRVDKKPADQVAELYTQRTQTMLIAAGVASFTIVAVAAAMMALLY